ncbi:polyphosphate kinase [Algihabitans albus]|uniref:polyphosphate kinase 2 family protein n=1 Tax=Algihabitans albus TaxID=2164067 RepID=UPI0035CF1F44
MPKHSPPRLADANLKLKADRESYDAELLQLQEELHDLQRSLRAARGRAIVVFEGWDAAGKGGAIRRMTARLDPRGLKVWPIGPPGQLEQQHHYMHRFWKRLPEEGTLAIFDRSWYGRVLVERVEGLAPKPDWQRAYREINTFERLLCDDGLLLIKLFMHISPAEQLHRFQRRLDDPTKRWKLTPEDLRNRSKQPAYEKAISAMLQRTSTKHAPWTVIPAEDKRYGRLAAMRTVIKGLHPALPPPPTHVDSEVARLALGLNLRLPHEG